MYDSIGSDSGHEWIEIYNNDSDIDITGWKFYEADTNHGLTLKNGTWFITNGSYAIIADNWETFLLDYSSFNGTLFDSSFSLDNSGEFIAIKNSTTYFIDNLTYNSTCDNGDSLQLINGTWFCSLPTPGYENILILNITNQTNQTQENETNLGKDLEIIVYLEDILNLFVEYTSLFKIINKNHQSGITDHINVTVSYNLSKNNTLTKEDFFYLTDLNSYKTADTGNIIFNETGNYTICGEIINSTVNDTNEANDFACKDVLVIDTRTIPCNISISISTEKVIYNNSESVKFYNILNNESFLYKIEYWIEDLFENEIKSRYNTSNTNQKSWTPNIDESDQVFLIKNRIAEIYCNDTALNDNFAEKLIIVKGERKKESTVNITNVYLGTDNKAKFGDSLSVRINIYKGDETKNNVKLWIGGNEKISKITSTNLYTNFVNYDLTLSVQIDPNCNEKYSDGDYTLFLTAFDKNDSAIVPLSGILTSNCKTTTKYVSGGTSEKADIKPLFEIISIPSSVDLNQEFTSKIRLNNEENEEHKYSLWSYVYRGSGLYSEGERETNLQELSIPSKSSALIELKNVALEEGDFKFKIKIRKDEQKTTKDITQDMNVLSLKEEKEKKKLDIKVEEEKEGLLAKKNGIIKNIFLSEKEPNILYISSSFKARKLASFFILFLLSYLLIFIIWKKTI